MPDGQLTLTFDKAGSYGAYVTSYNSIGYSDSEWIGFTVYDSAPTFSKISVDKEIYAVNNEVKFNFDSDSGIWYSVGVYKNGERYDSIWDITDKTYVYKVTEPGEYSVYVTSRNSCGWTDSETVHFYVISKIQGDINNDGKLMVSDAVLLQKWLLGMSNTEIANWKAADLCEDGKLDVFDMIEMRKLIINSQSAQ